MYEFLSEVGVRNSGMVEESGGGLVQLVRVV